MAATLTERYIGAVTKSLHPDAQNDVRTELAASIADAVEARVEQGEPRQAAERAVLTDLGNPGVLAAGYADRPLHLIGPRFYLAWWRLMKLLWSIVPAVVLAVVALAKVIEGGTVGEVIGAAIAAGIGAIVHVAFWVTLVFFILERTNSETDIGEWNVDMLPEPEADRPGRADLIASLIFLVVCAGAVIWDAVLGFVPTGTGPLPILNPALWPWWMVALFAIMAAEAVFAIVVYVRGRWTTGLAIANSALAVLFVSWGLTLLGRGQLVNPEFIDFAFTASVDENALRVLAVITGFMIVGISAWDVADGWIKARRAQRAVR